MTTDLRIVSDPAELARAAAAEFARHASAAVRERNLFSVALSGGSTPKLLYAELANDPSLRDRLSWDKIHFFWGDERAVPPDDEESNFRLAHDALLSQVPVPPENVHRIRAEETDPALAASDYERELRNFFQLNSQQLPRFDLILLGLGPDGHTASLFPSTDALNETEHLVVANWIERLKTHRITVTFPVLNNAASVLFLVSGSEKANVLRDVISGANTDEYPAQRVRPTSGTVTWLVDEDAASQISRAADK